MPLVQALEVATWAGLLKAPRAVLAGDHLQLPPVVLSDAAAAQGLGRTLFERLHAQYGRCGAAIQRYTSAPHAMPKRYSGGGGWSCTVQLYSGGSLTTPCAAGPCRRCMRRHADCAVRAASPALCPPCAAPACARCPLVLGLLLLRYRMNSAIMQWASEEMYQVHIGLGASGPWWPMQPWCPVCPLLRRRGGSLRTRRCRVTPWPTCHGGGLQRRPLQSPQRGPRRAPLRRVRASQLTPAPVTPQPDSPCFNPCVRCAPGPCCT
jgi:hypothetical protein